MVDCGIRQLQPLTRSLGLLVLALLDGCRPGGTAVDAAARLGIEPAAVVDIGSAAVASAVGEDGRVSIVAFHERDGEWVASPLTSSPGTLDGDSLHVISSDGATGEEWNSFVFGTAAPGTVQVELAGFPDQRGGTVVGGAWIIALREKGLGPDDIEWRFVDEEGTVRTGRGIFPPDV